MARKRAMSPEKASSKKLGGHKSEEVFNIRFGNKDAKINYSGASSDCKITDEKIFSILKQKLNVKSPNVSLKGGDTIQIHLGWFSELTDRDFWNANLGEIEINGKICTSSEHGIDFKDQEKILRSYSFWKKYLAKGGILCYRDSENEWIFFNMDDVINFIIANFEWRLLETGRIKGDCNGKQYITYEYRSESHKQCFVLGAHGGKKGKEFIQLLIENIPFIKDIR